MGTRILRSQLRWLEVGHCRDMGAVWLEGEMLSGVCLWWRRGNREQRYMYYGEKRGGADNLDSLLKQHSPVLSNERRHVSGTRPTRLAQVASPWSLFT
jgi:hypothetical protein